ncbi:hypothetical protein M569_11041 [Genlisea aurea]|uniref:Uncharacterized protein n=1 Tax=Genlisea aurea TaxID=192259 RepID=S8DLH2_9LAMI|nr:hypothetical protein M569_11041 [Genlisea aurea]
MANSHSDHSRSCTGRHSTRLLTPINNTTVAAEITVVSFDSGKDRVQNINSPIVLVDEDRTAPMGLAKKPVDPKNRLIRSDSDPFYADNRSGGSHAERITCGCGCEYGL